MNWFSSSTLLKSKIKSIVAYSGLLHLPTWSWLSKKLENCQQNLTAEEKLILVPGGHHPACFTSFPAPKHPILNDLFGFCRLVITHSVTSGVLEQRNLKQDKIEEDLAKR